MRLTIIVPVYNVESYLEECLNSLLFQKDVQDAYEIICVNDGSADRSGEILEHFSHTYQNLRVITQENKGLSGARNTGIALAEGEYIWFVDSDDVIDEYAVGELLRIAASQDSPDKLLFQYNEFQDGHLDACRCEQKQSGEITVFSSGKEMDRSKIVPLWKIACNYIMKSAILRDHALSFVEGILFEDEEFNFWLTRYTGICVYIPAVFYYYRKREGSILNTFMGVQFEKYLNGRLILADKHREIYRSYGEDERICKTVKKKELEAAILYDIQGILARLLLKGDKDYFETYLERLKQKGYYPYHTPWKNIIPRKSPGKTLINWAALFFPRERILRLYMAVRRLKRRG